VDIGVRIKLDREKYRGDRPSPSAELGARGFRQVSIGFDDGIETYTGVADSSVLEVLQAVAGVVDLEAGPPAESLPLSQRDWRVGLHNEERVRGRRYKRRPYSERNERWDHEHCMLCTVTIADAAAAPDFVAQNSDVLVEGYVTGDDEWICQKCFADLRDELDLQLD